MLAALGTGAVLAFHVAHGDAGGTAATLTAPSGPVNGAYLVSDQQQFGNRFAADTGLDQLRCDHRMAVVRGIRWRCGQPAGRRVNNDWLNIGYTDSGTYGSGDGIWGSPTSAADATAGWIEGHDTIPGYGTASSGIRAIAGTAGQGAAVQIAAIQGSGWASSGYPGMDSLYRQVA